MEADKDSLPNIKLFFSCRKIKKPSSYRILFTQKGFGKLQETEALEEKEPNFKTPVLAQYVFGKVQQCQICLKESGEGGNYWVVNATLNDIVGGRNSTKKFKVEHMIVIAKAETIKTFSESIVKKTVTKTEGKEHIKEIVTEDRVKLGLRAKKLTNTESAVIGIFNKSDPFYRLQRVGLDGSLTKVFESENLKNTLNPKWKEIVIPLNTLVDEKKGEFVVEVWDDEKEKTPIFIGSTLLRVEELRSGKEEFPLQHPKHKHPGKLKIYQFDISTSKNEKDYIVQTNIVERERTVSSVPPPVQVAQTAKPSAPSLPLTQDDAYFLKRFLEYKKGGVELSSIVSIDFTKSNGDPSERSSLHFSGKDSNHYISALNSFVQVIKKFDSDKEVPVFGFGAYCEFPGFTKPDVQYLIPLTGDPEKPNVEYDNIVAVYKNCLKYLKFNGPTFVKPVLGEANKLCSKSKAYKSSEKYLLILILTDGAVDDLSPVKKELATAVNFPISIIMVGIGKGDFSGMKELIDEAKRLPRPFLQFVEYEKYKNDGGLLAESILRELPREVVSYMEMKKIAPVEVDVDLSDIEDQ